MFFFKMRIMNTLFALAIGGWVNRESDKDWQSIHDDNSEK